MKSSPPPFVPNPKFDPSSFAPSISPATLVRLAVIGLLVLVGLLMASSGTYVIQPGTRGVKVTLGKVDPVALPEGFGFKAPLITDVRSVSVRQETVPMKADCFSADLQQIKVQVNVLYRIRETGVVRIYTEYSGAAFKALVEPRVQEGLKEVTATQTAEQIVQNREDIKVKTLDIVRRKVGDLIEVVDVVIADVTLSQQLEHAIEAKMVQAQEAAKAKFIQQRTEIEASTAIIRAKGEAEAIRIRSEALRGNPELLQLQIIEKWDGRSPLVVGGGSTGGNGGTNILLPLTELQRQGPSSPAGSAPAPRLPSGSAEGSR